MSNALRFWRTVDLRELEPGACWEWGGSLNGKGYGRFFEGGAYVMAHRRAFELVCGEIPPDRQLDHLCRNRACVNPKHLEPVTGTENILRGAGFCAKNARKTHCPQGHPYSGDNLLIGPDSHGGVRRDCRECKRERNRQWRARQRLATGEQGDGHGSSELKPCPFCGSEATHEGNEQLGYDVRCSNTECLVPVAEVEGGTLRECFDKWNRRAPSPELSALLDAVRDVLRPQSRNSERLRLGFLAERLAAYEKSEGAK